MPGRDNARDFAAYEFFARTGFFHLLADGDAVAALDQAGDVTVSGMIWHAAHGHGLTALFVARRQSDLKLTRGGHGIFEEKFVEVAQPEEQECARNLLSWRPDIAA